MSLSQESYDRYYLDVIDMIEKYGHCVQGVFPTVDDPEGCSFAYTIGLHPTYPEFMIRGLSATNAQGVLNELVKFLRNTNAPTEIGTVLNGVLGNDMPILIDCYQGPDEDWGVANLINGHDGFEKRLLIWPDTEGLLPPEMDEDMYAMQMIP